MQLVGCEAVALARKVKCKKCDQQTYLAGLVLLYCSIRSTLGRGMISGRAGIIGMNALRLMCRRELVA